jgi:biopolymer transport protein ExbB
VPASVRRAGRREKRREKRREGAKARRREGAKAQRRKGAKAQRRTGGEWEGAEVSYYEADNSKAPVDGDGSRSRRRIVLALLTLAIGFVGVVPICAQTPAVPGSEPTEAPRGLLQIMFAGGWVGVSIMIVLLLLSVTALYLVIEHLLTIRREELMPEQLQNQLSELLMNGTVSAAEGACKAEPSLLSFVVLQGLAERDGGWSAVEKALEDALAEQAARLMRKIEYLSVIGNIAPMVGLLGTVTGMVMAFHEIATSQGAAGAADLAEGIYQALVTTVVGLLIAIPSLGIFAVLRNRVDQLVAEAAYMVQHLCRPLKRRLSAVQNPAPTPVPPPPARN